MAAFRFGHVGYLQNCVWDCVYGNLMLQHALRTMLLCKRKKFYFGAKGTDSLPRASL